MKTMTREQIRKMAPAVFAEQPAETVSDKYVYQPTLELLDVVEKEGWKPFEAMQARTTVKEWEGYQRHMVSLTHPDLMTNEKGLRPTITIVNGHNAKVGLRLRAGFFRLICSNGLMVSSGHVQQQSFVHVDYSIGAIQEFLKNYIGGLAGMFNRVDDFRAISMKEDEQFAFADEVKQFRYPTPHNIETKDLLMVRRKGDEGNDLWTVLNRVQEAVVRGGVPMKGTNGGMIYDTITKPLTAIDKLVTVNEKVWEIAENYASN